jgi:hypothetical protein
LVVAGTCLAAVKRHGSGGFVWRISAAMPIAWAESSHGMFTAFIEGTLRDTNQ